MGYITIPAEITTAQDKMAYALRCAELLRLEHNKKGAAVDKDNPAELQLFRDWQSNVFMSVQHEALQIANDAKQTLYNDIRYDAQIDAAAILSLKESDL